MVYRRLRRRPALADSHRQAIGPRPGGVDRGQVLGGRGVGRVGRQPARYLDRRDGVATPQFAPRGSLYVLPLDQAPLLHRQWLDYVRRIGPPRRIRSVGAHRGPAQPPGPRRRRPLNILHGHGEYGSSYWAARYQTVFTRMEALGLSFAGPHTPLGRQAYPWHDELPRDSRNVPTYYSTRQTPETATRQLDFVFASNSIIEGIKVKALNEPEQWGPSDHCRLEVQVA